MQSNDDLGRGAVTDTVSDSGPTQRPVLRRCSLAIKLHRFNSVNVFCSEAVLYRMFLGAFNVEPWIGIGKALTDV